MADIAPADIERMLADLTAAGKAESTIVNAYKPLSQILDYAVTQGWLSESPCVNVEAPEVTAQSEIAYLQPEELDALLRAVDLDSTYGSTDRALYATAMKAGLRQGELLALRWRNVDWTAARIRVRLSFDRIEDGPPKSKAAVRAAPLPDSLAAE